jgi:hypothetical protein
MNGARFGKPGFLISALMALQAHADSIEPVATINIGSAGRVESINAKGELAGYIGEPFVRNAFVWSPEAGLLNLKDILNESLGGEFLSDWSEALLITDSGEVLGKERLVGLEETIPELIFSWTPDGGVVRHLLTFGDEFSFWDRNARTGQLVGEQRTTTRQGRAVVVSRAGGVVDICGPEYPASGRAIAVSGSGDVVGFCSTTESGALPFIWSEATGLEILAELDCQPADVNDHRQVVGTCREWDGSKWVSVPFYWSAEDGIIHLHDGFESQRMVGINNSGQVVFQRGAFSLGSVERAYFWSKDTGRILMDPRIDFGSDVLGITDSDHVIGFTRDRLSGSGQFYAFIWTLEDGLLPLRNPETDRGLVAFDWGANGHVIVADSAENRWWAWTPWSGLRQLDFDGRSPPSTLNHRKGAVNDKGQFTTTARLGGISWATLWNIDPISPAPVLIAPDRSTPSALSVLMETPGELAIFDTADGRVVSSIPFHGDALVTFAAQRLPDLDGDGIAEAVVWALRKSDRRAIAEIRNVERPYRPRQVWFTNEFEFFAARAFPVSESVASSGLVLAVLGLNPDGRPWAQIKDAQTEDLVSRVFFDPAFKPIAFEVLGDIDGNGYPELAVIGVDDVGRVRAQVKDSVTGTLVSLVYFDRRFIPSHAIGVDVSGDGFNDAIAVLGENDSGVVRAQVKEAATGALVGLVRFESGYAPFVMVALPDLNGNESPELGVLHRNDAGVVRVQVKDAVSGAPVSVVRFSGDFYPRDLAVIPDLDGSGSVGLLYLGSTRDEQHFLQLKNAASGTTVFSSMLQ